MDFTKREIRLTGLHLESLDDTAFVYVTFQEGNADPFILINWESNIRVVQGNQPLALKELTNRGR
jgi:hypothetical protein